MNEQIIKAIKEIPGVKSISHIPEFGDNMVLVTFEPETEENKPKENKPEYYFNDVFTDIADKIGVMNIANSFCEGNDYELEVEWKYPTDSEVAETVGSWNEKTAKFTNFFPQAGEHEAKLKLIYAEL